MLQGGLSDLHIILWKFVVIDMVKVDTEGAKYDVDKVWTSAVRRLASRVEASRTALERRVASALDLGRDRPSLTPGNRSWAPLLHFEYHDDFQLSTHYSAPYRELLSLLDP